MGLGKEKLKYVVNYGIAHFFAERLNKQVSESQWFAVCYIESLNKIFQESEMDLVLRFCDTCKRKIQAHYWDSMFLEHENAADLLEKIIGRLAGLDLSKKNQVVDGWAQLELQSSLRYEKRKRRSWIE